MGRMRDDRQEPRNGLARRLCVAMAAACVAAVIVVFSMLLEPEHMASLLSRYARSEHGEIIIDVAASRVQDLYNDFDRHAPYVRRDLDQDLVEYLQDCAKEIGRCPFVIRITLGPGRIPSGEVVTRVKQSVRRFFGYMSELERRKIRRAGLTSLAFLVVGLCIFAVTTLTGGTASVGFPWPILREGLTVAGWVAVWEALATFLIRWGAFRRSLRLYHRLAEASVSVQWQEES